MEHVIEETWRFRLRNLNLTLNITNFGQQRQIYSSIILSWNSRRMQYIEKLHCFLFQNLIQIIGILGSLSFVNLQFAVRRPHQIKLEKTYSM